jgi:Tfp pilus assembly protein PilN
MTLTTTAAEQSTMRSVGSGFAVMPRVNLLPPEIAQRRALRRIQVLLGASLAGVAVVVGLVYVAAAHSASAAQEDLTAKQAEGTQLQTQVSSFANVNAIYAAADAAQAQLTTAMSDEVRVSQLLTGLRLRVPSNVCIPSMNHNPPPPPAAAGGTPTLTPAIGSLTVTGIGFSHNDVGLWLESIAGVKTYSDPYFSASTESLLGTRKIVTFNSTANLTSAALSNRYTAAALTPTAGG